MSAAIMSKPLQYLIALFFASFFISCNNEIKFPAGGYDYPAFLKDNLKDSFYQAYYFPYWCKAYDEPDLSSKSMGENTFRLIYQTAFNEEVVFTMTKAEIVVKKPLEGHPYPAFDSLILDGVERHHFKILQQYFPIQEYDANIKRKAYLDSLANVYPQLLDPYYYKALLNKAIRKDLPLFKYSIKRVPISESKYKSIVDQINLSGYWKLPRHIECTEDYADGYGFGLEANTAKKYNFVTLANCPEKAYAFSKACQSIIDASNPDKKIIIVSN